MKSESGPQHSHGASLSPAYFKVFTRTRRHAARGALSSAQQLATIVRGEKIEAVAFLAAPRFFDEAEQEQTVVFPPPSPPLRHADLRLHPEETGVNGVTQEHHQILWRKGRITFATSTASSGTKNGRKQ